MLMCDRDDEDPAGLDAIEEFVGKLQQKAPANIASFHGPSARVATDAEQRTADLVPETLPKAGFCKS
jgi:hypothetical protein